MKYFYLLFSDEAILPLTDVVFNTEAHPFPRFEMGKLFKTGWTRRKDGGAPASQDSTHDSHGGETRIQTIEVTHTVEQQVATKASMDDDQTPAPTSGEVAGANALINEAAAP